MMKKIAVTGANKDHRFDFINLLNADGEYQVLGSPHYSKLSGSYGLESSMMSSGWEDLYAYAVAAFTQRVEEETFVEKMISDGSVFLELCILKVLLSRKSNTTKLENRYQKLMIEGLERLVISHALSIYDCFIHISYDKIQSSFNQAVNKRTEELMKHHNVSFISINTDNKTTIDKVIEGTVHGTSKTITKI